MTVLSIAQVAVRLKFLLLSTVILAACSSPTEPPLSPADTPPVFAGADICADCHSAEFDAWSGSHHALAMQTASADTVLGDFGGIEVEHFGSTTTFTERDGLYFVRTAGDDGEMQEFPVSYTFGVTPLQQYLIELPRGRLQALSVAWDSRPEDAGGQRWYHLYPDFAVGHTDSLHWTGREQNWNFMCAECHSTGLQKNYSPDSDAFDSTWSEINVACEACHGPGSRHVAQARDQSLGGRAGLLTDLDDAGRATWEMNPDTGIAARSEVRMRPPAQPEACGRCHSRRSVITDQYEYGRPLLDTHGPSLLDEGLYYPDGQIQEEVYVYGSFLQSRMYQAGVSCSDCHDPHSGALRAGGEPSNVCAACHLPTRFDTGEHHRHPDDSVACVDCHMTTRNYMVVDGRRDHSFRIPRPDVTVATGSPNACNQCHTDRDAAWAADAVTGWYGETDRAHFATGILAGRAGGANQALLDVAAVAANPGIVRGTALSLLRPPYSREVAEAIQRALGSGDPLIRLGALRALPGLQAELQADWAGPSLSHELRAIRIEAARVASPLRDILHVRFENAFRAAERELKGSFLANAERPEAQMGLANLYLEAGDTGMAEAAYRAALRLEPNGVLPRINLADLYRRLGRDGDAESLLRESIDANPDEPAYHHSLGLLLVRQRKEQDGLLALRTAAELQANNARYAYVYAVALHSLGQSDAAVEFLRGVRTRFSGDFDVAWALATILRDQGRAEEARAVATDLAAIYPGVQPVQALLDSL